MAGFSVDVLEGGSTSWNPKEIGDKIKGTIRGIKRVQQTDFTTGEPLFWSNNDPRMQTVVELQTNEREGDDDEGVRTVWLKGGRNYEAAEGKGSSGEVALAMAAKDAGVTSIEEGSELTIVHSGLAKPTTRGFQPAKLYAMKLVPAKASVAVDDFDFDD